MDKDIKRNHFAERTYSAPVRWGAVVKVTGEDAADFLQGQFSQELRVGKATRISYGFWLSRTGKVEGDAWVVRERDGGFTLLSRNMTAVQLIERLEHHIIADDVMLSDETGSYTAWWIVGANAEACRMRLDPGDESGRGWVLGDPVSIGPGSGYWVGASDPDWGEGVEIVDEAQIETWRIIAGVPRVPIDVGMKDMPQEGGLERVGVSFNKGCYLGQEVMARVQNTGRVRRRLISVAGLGEPPSGMDETILLGDRVVGSLRSRVCRGRDRSEWFGIAMVSEAVERGSEASLILEADGSALRWQEIGAFASRTLR